MNEQEKIVVSTRKRLNCITVPRNKVNNGDKVALYKDYYVNSISGEIEKYKHMKAIPWYGKKLRKSYNYHIRFLKSIYDGNPDVNFLSIREFEIPLLSLDKDNKMNKKTLFFTEVSFEDILSNKSYGTEYGYYNRKENMKVSGAYETHSKIIITYDKEKAERITNICKLYGDLIIKYYKYMVDNKKLVSFLDALSDMGIYPENYKLNPVMFKIYKYIFHQIELIFQTLYKIYHTDEFDIEYLMEVKYDTVFLFDDNHDIVSFVDLFKNEYSLYHKIKNDIMDMDRDIYFQAFKILNEVLDI